MRAVALVPFKSFSYAKTRLRSRFSDADVASLGRAMLEDVLNALVAVPELEAVRVLTDDEQVAEVARAGGAAVRISQPDPGLNEVIEAANEEALSAGTDATLVVLGDLPLLRPEDVQEVVLAGKRSGIVLVPSGDGGTAMLLRRPPDLVPTRFGPGSLDRHVAVSRGRGVEPVLIDAIPEAYRLDLDTPEDAARILDSGRPGRTVELLRKLCSQ